jgi:hypothetical protein
MSTRTDDYTAPIDRPSEQTLQLLWKEKADLRSVSFLRRPGVTDGTIHRGPIAVVEGPQPYKHNHYHDSEFFRADPDRGTVTNPYGQRVMRVSEDFLVGTCPAKHVAV